MEHEYAFARQGSHPSRHTLLATCLRHDPVASETLREVLSSLDGLDVSTPTIARRPPRGHLLDGARRYMEVHVRHSLVRDESIV
ncbi:hypothetical protein GCM10023317_96780 [Actinopolymorpha pittospori]